MNSYNYTQGLECKFNFYVITFDPQNYENFKSPVLNLDFNSAKEEFRKAVTSVPIHISTVMGVNFITDNINLEPDGTGAIDLIQFNNGTLELSQDINYSELLKNEPLISINAISELKEYIPVLQNELDSVFEIKKVADMLGVSEGQVNSLPSDVRNEILEYYSQNKGLDSQMLSDSLRDIYNLKSVTVFPEKTTENKAEAFSLRSELKKIQESLRVGDIPESLNNNHII